MKSKFLLKNCRQSMNSVSKKGFRYTVGHNTSDILKSQSVNIYKAPELEQIEEYLNKFNYYGLKGKNSPKQLYQIWQDYIFSNDASFKSKYFALLPFFFEDANTLSAKKKFILEMSLLSDTKYLKLKAATSTGVIDFVEPLEDIVPITAEDFKVRHLILRSRPADFIDGDMFYANRKTLTILCFDKQGTWNEEGVNHPLLNVKNTLNEANWFDHLKYDTVWL